MILLDRTPLTLYSVLRLLPNLLYPYSSLGHFPCSTRLPLPFLRLTTLFSFSPMA